MKLVLFIAFFILQLSTKVYAARGLPTKEICYSDINICLKIQANDAGKLMSIWITQHNYNRVDQDTKDWFKSLGVGFGLLTDAGYASVWKEKTIHTTVSAASASMDQISDEAWSVLTDSAGCVGAAIGCAASVGAALETGGATMFLLKIACGISGIQCSSAIRSYQKWEKLQRKLKEEQDKANQSGGGTTPVPGNPGSSGDLPPDTGSDRPGRPGGGVSDCRYCTITDGDD